MPHSPAHVRTTPRGPCTTVAYVLPATALHASFFLLVNVLSLLWIRENTPGAGDSLGTKGLWQSWLSWSTDASSGSLWASPWCLVFRLADGGPDRTSGWSGSGRTLMTCPRKTRGASTPRWEASLGSGELWSVCQAVKEQEGDQGPGAAVGTAGHTWPLGDV